MLKDLLERSGNEVLVAHNAGLLKYICYVFFDWDGAKDESGRSLLQHVGTDVIREKDPDYWVRFIVQMIQWFGERWDYVIVPDCRFPNEIAMFKENGFDTIHIRIHRESDASGLTENQKTHASETSLDDAEFDFCIDNNGSLHQLDMKIRNILEGIYGLF